MDGEDKIVENMKKFANDGECLDQLKGFKGEVQGQMAEYRAALLTMMKAEVTERACKSIIDGKPAGSDPVKAFFTKAFDEVSKADLATVKGKADGNIVERVAAVQQAREGVFQSSFMVSAAEAAEVKKLGGKALSGDSL